MVPDTRYKWRYYVYIKILNVIWLWLAYIESSSVWDIFCVINDRVWNFINHYSCFMLLATCLTTNSANNTTLQPHLASSLLVGPPAIGKY